MRKNDTQRLKVDARELPVHSLARDTAAIQILPLDHTNPYDFKREHRHTYYEIMLIERGGGNQLIDFRDYAAHDNSCYIIFPQQVHLMNRKNSSGMLIQFTEDSVQAPELLARLKQLSLTDNAAIVFERQPEALHELHTLLTLLSRYTQRKPAVSTPLPVHLLNAFLALVVLHSGDNDQAVVAPERKLLFDFYALLEQHFAENRGVRFFVQQLATTDKKLAAATRKHSGQTPLQVIHNRLLLEAKRLLAFEDTSHKEIAFQLGFDSPASFSAFIKSKTGLSPTELSGQLAEIHK